LAGHQQFADYGKREETSWPPVRRREGGPNGTGDTFRGDRGLRDRFILRVKEEKRSAEDLKVERERSKDADLGEFPLRERKLERAPA